MSSAPGTPTLDQLQVFLTVIDVGSFAGARESLAGDIGRQLFDRESRGAARGLAVRSRVRRANLS